MPSKQNNRRVSELSVYFKNCVKYVVANNCDPDILFAVIKGILEDNLNARKIRIDKNQVTGKAETYFEYQISKGWWIFWIESEVEAKIEIDGKTAIEFFTEIKFVKTDLSSTLYHSTTLK